MAYEMSQSQVDEFVDNMCAKGYIVTKITHVLSFRSSWLFEIEEHDNFTIQNFQKELLEYDSKRERNFRDAE